MPSPALEPSRRGTPPPPSPRQNKAREGVAKAGAGTVGRASARGAGVGVSRAPSSDFASSFNQAKSSCGSWNASRGTIRSVFAISDRQARRSQGQTASDAW